MITFSIPKRRHQLPKGSANVALGICVLFCCLSPANSLFAATLTIEPPTGTFVVGSTLNVPIYLNSEGEAVNAIAISAKFSPDKLQLVSPSIGRSVITLWTEQPHYDNQRGLVSLQGVIPNGLTTSNGLVTTMTFRVKAPGLAFIKFLDETKVLKHDGSGTDLLRTAGGAVYTLLLPPPAGPIVVSETHPDPHTTYRTKNVFLSWVAEDDGVTKYSYMLDDEPMSIPDDIAESEKTSIVYRDLTDGRHYFHIKGYRNGAWGGTTHFPVSIDTEPPAIFPVEILPGEIALAERKKIIQFQTTDTGSGIDHYELKIVPLSPSSSYASGAAQPLFVEAVSPFIIPDNLSLGDYDILVRAYDKAGNYRESIAHLKVVRRFFGSIGDHGIMFGEYYIIPWWLLIMLLTLSLVILLLIAAVVRRRHHEHAKRLGEQVLPESITLKRAALAEKQKQYVRITQLAIALLMGLSAWTHLAPQEVAAGGVTLDPPVVTTLSRHIANDEIFYIGGTVSTPGANIIVYLQHLSTGETVNEYVVADEKGEWFYRHDRFLAAGEYILWTQASLGGEMSPPTPELRLNVSRQALETGATRISYEFLFVAITLSLCFSIVVLLAYIIYHHRAARAKHERWLREVREAEEAVRTGFALLKRDIESELALVRKAKLTGTLGKEEIGKEEQLLRDLAWVEEHITKEIADVTDADRL